MVYTWAMKYLCRNPSGGCVYVYTYMFIYFYIRILYNCIYIYILLLPGPVGIQAGVKGFGCA